MRKEGEDEVYSFANWFETAAVREAAWTDAWCASAYCASSDLECCNSATMPSSRRLILSDLPILYFRFFF